MVPAPGGETLKNCTMVDENGFPDWQGGLWAGSGNWFADDR